MPRVTRNTRPAVKKRNKITTSVTKRGQSKRETAGQSLQIYVGIIFAAFIVVGFGFLLFWGYQKVSASSFFDLKSDKIDIRGAKHVSSDKVKEIVQNEALKTGVWKADIKEIRSEIEKFDWVKSAVVSRVLPDGLRVRITEREPRAVMRDEKGYDFWIDDDAKILGQVDSKEENRPPFVLKGLNDDGRNRERVKNYLQMLDEWQALNLAKRVKFVNLDKLDEAQAIVPDTNSGDIPIKLGNKDFGKRLKSAIQTLDEKRQQTSSPISYLISDGDKVTIH